MRNHIQVDCLRFFLAPTLSFPACPSTLKTGELEGTFLFFSIIFKKISEKLPKPMFAIVIVSEREINRLAETEGGEL